MKNFWFSKFYRWNVLKKSERKLLEALTQKDTYTNAGDDVPL